MSITVALAALHAAADSIRLQQGIVEATADNDADSGEIVFTTQDGKSYVLRLQETQSEVSTTSDEIQELQVASMFLQHLGFPDATMQNARRVAALLELMAAACDIVTPGEETDEQDARQLAIQIEGMSERIGQRNTKG